MRRSISKAIRAALLVGAVASLAGCATPQEIRLADENQCGSYGFQRGTVAFSQCLQQESLARRYGWWSPGWPPGGPWF